MRHVAAVLITTVTVLLFSPELFARDKHSWEQVEKLKPGSSVLVGLWNGDILSGHVVGVSSTGLRLSSFYPPGPGPAPKIDRAAIKRLVLLRGNKLPDPGTWMLAGTLIGGGVGVTAGAIQDATGRNNGRWVTGGLRGAAAGFLGSCVVLTGVGATALVRHNKVVYESKTPPPARPQARDDSDARGIRFSEGKRLYLSNAG